MPLFNKDYLIKARDAYQRELSHDNTILTTLGLCITDEKGLYVHMCLLYRLACNKELLPNLQSAYKNMIEATCVVKKHYPLFWGMEVPSGRYINEDPVSFLGDSISLESICRILLFDPTKEQILSSTLIHLDNDSGKLEEYLHVLNELLHRRSDNYQLVFNRLRVSINDAQALQAAFGISIVKDSSTEVYKVDWMSNAPKTMSKNVLYVKLDQNSNCFTYQCIDPEGNFQSQHILWSELAGLGQLNQMEWLTENSLEELQKIEEPILEITSIRKHTRSQFTVVRNIFKELFKNNSEDMFFAMFFKINCRRYLWPEWRDILLLFTKIQNLEPNFLPSPMGIQFLLRRGRQYFLRALDLEENLNNAYYEDSIRRIIYKLWSYYYTGCFSFKIGPEALLPWRKYSIESEKSGHAKAFHNYLSGLIRSGNSNEQNYEVVKKAVGDHLCLWRLHNLYTETQKNSAQRNAFQDLSWAECRQNVSWYGDWYDGYFNALAGFDRCITMNKFFLPMYKAHLSGERLMIQGEKDFFVKFCHQEPDILWKLSDQERDASFEKVNGVYLPIYHYIEDLFLAKIKSHKNIISGYRFKKEIHRFHIVQIRHLQVFLDDFSGVASNATRETYNRIKERVGQQIKEIQDSRIQTHRTKARGGQASDLYERKEYYRYLSILMDFDREEKKNALINIVCADFHGDLELNAHDLQEIDDYCSSSNARRSDFYESVNHELKNSIIDGKEIHDPLIEWITEKIFLKIMGHKMAETGLFKLEQQTTQEQAYNKLMSISRGLSTIIDCGEWIVGDVTMAAVATAHPVPALLYAGTKLVIEYGGEAAAVIDESQEMLTGKPISGAIKDIKRSAGLMVTSDSQHSIDQAIPTQLISDNPPDVIKHLFTQVQSQLSMEASAQWINRHKFTNHLMQCLLNNYLSTNQRSSIQNFIRNASFLALYAPFPDFEAVDKQIKQSNKEGIPQTFVLHNRRMKARVKIDGQDKEIIWCWGKGSKFNVETNTDASGKKKSFCIEVGDTDPDAPVGEAAEWEVEFLNLLLSGEPRAKVVPGVQQELLVSDVVFCIKDDSKKEKKILRWDELKKDIENLSLKIVPLGSQNRYCSMAERVQNLEERMKYLEDAFQKRRFLKPETVRKLEENINNCKQCYSDLQTKLQAISSDSTASFKLAETVSALKAQTDKVSALENRFKKIPEMQRALRDIRKIVDGHDDDIKVLQNQMRDMEFRLSQYPDAFMGSRNTAASSSSAAPDNHHMPGLQ